MDNICNKYPRLVMIEITTRCNLLCDYCFKSKSNFRSRDMSWEVFSIVKDRISTFEYISFCGMGEQLLHRNFYEMVSSLECHKLLIITNGTVLIDYERLLEKDNIHTITFSVDGPNKEIAQRSCVKYDFDNLMINLEKGMKYKSVVKGINYVLGPGNLEYSLDMFKFCKDNGISSINFLLPSHNPKWIQKNIRAISSVLSEADKLAKENNLIYSGPYKKHCIFEGAVIPVITSSGFVRPCCNHENSIRMAGNILENSFDKLWENDYYRTFRSGYYCGICNMYKKFDSGVSLCADMRTN